MFLEIFGIAGRFLLLMTYHQYFLRVWNYWSAGVICQALLVRFSQGIEQLGYRG